MKTKQFISACSSGNIDKVRSLLHSGMPVDSTDRYGLSALINAARKGRIEVAQLLLQHGAEVDFPDKRRRTPLFHAVCFNQLEMVKLLARHGANLDVVDTHNGTPCKMAESQRFFELMELLRTLGAMSCPPLTTTLQLCIFLNNLHVKDGTSSYLAENVVQKLAKKLQQVHIQTNPEKLDTVSVALVVGVNLAIQPVRYENRAAFTDIGIPECDLEALMKVNVLNAIRIGFKAIGEFLAKEMGETVDYEKLADATLIAIDSVAKQQ